MAADHRRRRSTRLEELGAAAIQHVFIVDLDHRISFIERAA